MDVNWEPFRVPHSAKSCRCAVMFMFKNAKAFKDAHCFSGKSRVLYARKEPHAL